MFSTLIGIFVVLHGLVHLWYVTLSLQLVEFQPAMGWTGSSWLLPATLQTAAGRPLASLLFAAATITFAASGVGILTGSDWWRPVLIGSAVLSSTALLVFWDGSTSLLVEKGVLGLAINAVILAVLLIA